MKLCEWCKESSKQFTQSTVEQVNCLHALQAYVINSNL